MLIKCKQLIGLPVFTKSGTHLGKIKELDFDSDSLQVVKIHARHPFGKELIIDRTQIIEITLEKAIVDDLLIKNIEKVKNNIIKTPKTAAIVSGLNKIN